MDEPQLNTLPPEAVPVTPVDATNPVAALETPHLLLVDDCARTRDGLQQLLAARGFQVSVAADGAQALAQLAERRCDVLLLDLLMPGMSGLEVIRQVTDSGLDTRVIVVSADASFAGAKAALTAGAFDFVCKPYLPDELLTTVDRALQQLRLQRSHASIAGRLRESELLHRFIVDNSPDLVYMLDAGGRFTFVNAAVQALLGYGRDELLGLHFADIVVDEDQEAARFVFNERRTGERASRNVELRLRHRDTAGARHFSTHMVCIELSSMGVYTDTRERAAGTFVGTYGVARDITERKEAEEVINFQAYHDLLTHLPNRALLKDRLALAITQTRRNKGRLAVMFLDLDRFKLVNDTLGHSMGDRLLKAVARRLQGCLRQGDTLSRFGGDEFTLLLPEVRTHDDVVVIARKILEQLSAPFSIDDHELSVGASIGIAMYPEAGNSVESLIQNADIAMYHIKGRGKNGYQFFSEDMNRQFNTRLTLERELRAALAGQQLRVHYQPQVELASGRISGVEALVRWQHPERGLVLPETFMAVAQETGMVVPLDELVQASACAQVARWHALGHQLTISLNLTAAQLDTPDFEQRMLAMIAASGLAPQWVRVELTENTIMQNIEATMARLRGLRAHGVRIAIDDFGTGYSSLSYLQRFPVDTLKVDRTFVSNILGAESDTSIVTAIVSMARGLGLELVAEGVETALQLAFLRAQGCDAAQGFIFSPALEAQQLLALLQGPAFEVSEVDVSG